MPDFVAKFSAKFKDFLKKINRKAIFDESI